MAEGSVTTGEGASKQDWKITVREFTDSGSPTASWNEDRTEEEWSAYSKEYDSKFPSGQYGYIDVRGPKKSAVLSVRGHVKGGMLRKFGFREYVPSSDKPRYYLQESASGGFPGCAERNADPKTYSGNQRYDFAQWGPRYSQSFSRDVWNSGYYSHSGGTNWQRWQSEGNSPFPDSESPTRREWVEGSDCNDARIEDRITFQLTEELTLSRMKQLVEANFSRTPEQQRWPFPGWSNEAAVNFTSEDEELYVHQKFYHYFLVNIPSHYPFSQNERLNLSFKYRILRINLFTGRVTESTRSINATWPRAGRGMGNDFMRVPEDENSFLELTAQSGEMAVIRPAPAKDQPRKDLFCHPAPLAYFKNEPRKMPLSRTIPIEPQWDNSDEFEEKRSE